MTQSLALNVVGYDYHGIQLTLDEATRSDDIVFAEVLSAKGNTMAKAGVRPSQADDRLTFLEAIMFDGNTVGKLYLYMNNEKIVRQLEARINSLIGREIFIVVLVAIGEFLALSYIIARPVSIIARGLIEHTDEDGVMTKDIDLASRDEFGSLAAQFNTMRARMDAVYMRLLSKVSLADEELKKKNQLLEAQSRDLQKMNDKLELLSVTDPLTGVYNRRYFDALVRKELTMTGRYDEPTSLLMIDIDFFKDVNDTRGHPIGDLVLCQLSQTITASSRETDTLCRIGGEEFAVLCRHSDKDASVKVAEKMRKTIAEHTFGDDEDPIKLTVSIGAMTVTKAGEIKTMEELCDCVDTALYFCKHSGRNCVHHFEDIEVAKSAEGAKVTA